MAAEKARHTIWLTNEAWEKVKNNYRSDNCSTQQEAIIANLIAADTDVDLKTMETLTGTCVNQVTRVHGALGYEDALRFQKRLD